MNLEDHVTLVAHIGNAIPVGAEGVVVAVNGNDVRVRITSFPPECQPQNIQLPWYPENYFVVGGQCH